MRRMMIGLAALALIGASCTMADDTVATPFPSPSTTAAVRGAPSARTINAVLASHSLVPFDACDDYLSYMKAQALEHVGPYGLDTGYGGYGIEFFASEGTGRLDDMQATTSAPVVDVDRSGTNVQEAGVDEPDLVKSDGSRIVTLLDGVLRIVAIDAGVPRLAGSLSLGDYGYAQDLFLAADTVLVMVASGGTVSPLRGGWGEGDIDFSSPYGWSSPITRLIEITIADGDNPRVVRSMDIDGRYLSSRMIDDTARIVISSQPTGLVFSYPEGGGLRADRRAERANRAVIEASTIENWVPYVVTKDGVGRVVDEGTLVDCTRLHHPEEFSGLGLLSVATIDLGNGLDVVDSTGLVASGETVYASSEGLYVATQRWVDWSNVAFDDDTGLPENQLTTEIHRFDITQPDRADYTATGQVTGWLLNQWAMSEHEGYLRVVATNGPTWQRWGPTESSVAVLRIDDAAMTQVGIVDGIGKDENVYSVRFMGDTGYVVTFRQIDPLYTLDLSDPEHPAVVGELKIPGYSAYLHPVGDGLLLGVGQNATNEGRVLGASISLFDVSDPARPRRIDQIDLGDGSSDVEYDHRAFTFWDDQAFVPVQSWSENFDGVFGITVGDQTLKIAGKVAHRPNQQDWTAHILRSLVIGDHLYTVSQAGIMQSDLAILTPTHWTGFASSQ